MQPSPIKNLIFDLGNVIIDLDFAASEKLLQEMVDVSFLSPARDDLEIFIDFECGRISEGVFLNYLIRKSAGKAQAVDLIRAWTAMLANIPYQRLTMLRDLREQYRVFLLSNTNETHIRWVDHYLLENYQIPGLSSLVHHAFYSHDLKSRKPEEEIYRKMLEIASIDPQESLFFDDHPANIQAAREMGIHGYLVPPEEEIIEIVPLALAMYP